LKKGENMGKIYKTANGKQLDMEALTRANEETIAIGNAGLNARGDLIGANGKIKKTRAERMKEIYADTGNTTKNIKR
jgi:ABC-type hemin transport system substrate-binding protein